MTSDWPPKLGSHEAALWYVLYDADSAATFLSAWEKTLRTDEIARARRIRSPSAHTQFLLGRGLIRSVLSSYADLPPADWQFTSNPYGKPAIAARHKVSFAFNLAHCPGLVVCGVTGEQAIGVDCEHLARGLAYDDVAEHFFAPDEVEYLHSLSGQHRLKAFLEMWTVKEALVKCLGQGLSMPLSQFSVQRQTDGDLVVTFPKDHAASRMQWQFFQPYLSISHTVAVALARPVGQAYQLSLYDAGALIT
jgi:4'-phosphopantetheinyl transferase